ncbi:MAG: hypothetical protein IT449_00160 [Phycisphaerales bacterium]|nr:hypothetical protein [Phycisphaerales bacterium]
MYIDNQSVAIMTRVNELGERFGLTPSAFFAILDKSRSGTEVALHFIDSPSDAKTEERRARVYATLGISRPELSVRGTREEILDTLQQALQRAPHPSPRR